MESIGLLVDLDTGQSSSRPFLVPRLSHSLLPLTLGNSSKNPPGTQGFNPPETLFAGKMSEL